MLLLRFSGLVTVCVLTFIICLWTGSKIARRSFARASEIH